MGNLTKRYISYLFGGKEMKTSELLEEFKGLTLTTLNNNKEDILDVLTQPPDYFTIQKN